MPTQDWTDPKEWLEGEKLKADELILQLTNNLTFLFEKNFDVVQVTGVSDYQTTATSVTDVASTLKCNLRKYKDNTVLKLGMTANVYHGTASAFIYFDVLIDGEIYASSGTATPATEGLVSYQQDTANVQTQVSMEAYFSDLAEGVHTFQLVWWVSAGTGTMNVTNTIAQFSVEEYGVANVNVI